MDSDSLNLPATSGVYSKYSGKYVETKDQDDGFSNGSLDFDGYLKLLVSQMSNQDFNDPMSDADLLNQMAQYSMLEGIKDMTRQSAISYGASLVGKAVTVNEGRYYYTGLVDSINVDNGEVSITIDGKAFKTSSVTDIVDMDVYNYMKDIMGKKVKLKGSGESGGELGVVSAVVFAYGKAQAVVGEKTYRLDQLEVIEEDDENKTDEGTEGTEGIEGDKTEGVENNGETSGTGSENTGTEGTGTEGTEENKTEDPNALYAVETNKVNENAASSYAASAEALTDLLMKELDMADDDVKAVNAAAEDGMDNFNLEEIMQTAHVNVPEFAASASGDISDLVLTEIDGVITTYAGGDSSTSGVGNVSISDYNRVTGTGTIVDDRYTDTMPDDNSSAATTNSYTSSNTSMYTASGKLRGVTAPKGIATTDGVPHRISVEKYPEEAALADELGTRMYDISQIHNHEITSRIRTGPVISRTASGRGVTEVGYSGVGQLGEVVTFEDGTQRVEILLKSGKSTWLYTSGKYTLDQICTKNGAPGSLSNMTGAEKAIRYYADPNDRKNGSTILAQMRNA